MPEIDMLVGEAASAIGAAVGAYGVGVLTKTEEQAAEGTVRLGQRLLALILRRSADPAPVQGAVTDLAEATDDPDALASLRLQIRKALLADRRLAADLAALVPGGSGPQATRARSVAIGGTNSGIVSTGDGATNIKAR